MAINPNERFNRITVGGGRAANRNRTKGSGKLAGTTNPVYKANLARQNSNQSGLNLGNLGGMLSGFVGGGNVSQYGQQNIDFQKDLRDDIYNKTTMDVTGVGYENKFDENGNLISNLTGVNKDIYDQSGNLTTMFGNQMMDYNSGGFEAMEARQLAAQQALVADANEQRALQMRERDQNTGASLYQQYYGSRAEGDRINQQNLGFINNAFDRSIAGGNYLSGQRTGAQNSMLAAANPANTMLANQMTKVNATGNLTALAESGTMLADQQAAAAEAKSKGKNKFWNSVLKLGGDAIAPGLGTAASGLFT